MSRFKLATKLRQNAEYPAIVATLEELKLKFELFGPTGKGHPFLRIEIPGRAAFDFYVSCTPRGSGRPKAVVARLRRELRALGVAGA